MNLNIIKVIIGREYMIRVKKKSFLIITFLGPILFAAVTLLPAIIMGLAKEEAKNVAVVDRSGIVLSYLKSDDSVKFLDYSSMNPDSVKYKMDALGLDATLSVSPLDSTTKSVSVVSFSKKPLGVVLIKTIENAVNTAVTDYRIASYHIDGLDKIMKDVRSHISLTTYKLNDSGDLSLTDSNIYMFISMALGMIIYMFITMFSSMVMSGVVEEKSSRVVEVLISSVKSTELMFGKIIGIALVAVTQFLLWIVLTGILISVVGMFLGPELASSVANPSVTSTLGGGDVNGVLLGGSNQGTILSTLCSLNYVSILSYFIVYFILGYLLYASLFAAIGSASENEADTQQLAVPVTIPLLIGFFISIYAFKAPDSAVVFWGSMIPFTSPIVMMSRIPLGVPVWQIALSLVLLAGTFVLLAWMSAKIYNIGILMFGKKSTFKDLWKWIKQK